MTAPPLADAAPAYVRPAAAHALTLTHACRAVLDLWLLPRAWQRPLRTSPLPAFIDAIERDARARGSLTLPSVELFRRALGFRLRLSWHWRRNRCLLGCLLLYHFLLRSNVPATISFGVRLDGDRLAGHCWLSTATGVDLGRFARPGRMEEIYRHPSRFEERSAWPTSS